MLSDWGGTERARCRGEFPSGLVFSVGTRWPPDLVDVVPRTKEEGLAGSEAPRPVRRRSAGSRGRGAPGRRDKGLRGVKHHVGHAEGPLGPRDVVPPDEVIRDCGEQSTTSGSPEVRWVRGTWCPRTKEEGLAGSEAPRPHCRRPVVSEGRGAPGRRNKGLREVKHHVRFAGGPLGPRDVVPGDEGIRASGE